jgi:2-polyprenyl-3-methyl-5-hydroxy-6-metoxy-1,4-benzoquinol methylase
MEIVDQQISEPLVEHTLRSEIPHLTPIQDPVSQSVQKQYEENPYPRWIKPHLHNRSGSIASVLRETVPGLNLRNYVSPTTPEILIAGCGTGQHALGTATTFLAARILAVDLSVSSLSYAIRKSQELNVSNVDYAQADIMELGLLGKQFDLIECSGVLHHMDDPLAGWRVLVGLLKSDGLLKIALYSESARSDVVAGKALISKLEYSATPDDIRQCRQDFIAKANNGNTEIKKICCSKDFFSLSNIRDLLFHVQEHRFTIPQIASAVKKLGLEFLGFEMRDHRALRIFAELHSDRSSLTSLPLWHNFELENPDTFRGMYQFWCRKI